MSQTVEMHIIARIRSDFPTKFGIPRILKRTSRKNSAFRGRADWRTYRHALYSSRNTATRMRCAA